MLSTVYDLLTSPDCLPDLLQGGLAGQGVNEAFILTSFKLQPKTGTSVFGLYNPRDNSKYFEFTVMGKLNRGMQTRKSLWYLLNLHRFCILTEGKVKRGLLLMRKPLRIIVPPFYSAFLAPFS